MFKSTAVYSQYIASTQETYWQDTDPQCIANTQTTRAQYTNSQYFVNTQETHSPYTDPQYIANIQETHAQYTDPQYISSAPETDSHDTDSYGVALVSRIDKIIGLFCKRALQKRQYSAKETYNFIDPTHRSHPIPECTVSSPKKERKKERKSLLASAYKKSCECLRK